jgi:tetratricopeptide (TPR) repeat protein
VNSLILSYYFACFLQTDTVALVVKKVEEESIRKPGDIVVLVKLGFAYYAIGRIDVKMQDEAKDLFKDILTSDPSNATVHTGMGLLYDYKRMSPRAKAEYEKALKVNPVDIIALEHMGLIVKLDEGNPEGSLVYFKKILNILPDYPDANFYTGSTYYGLGKYEEALLYLNKTTELDPLGISKGYFSSIITGDIYMKQKKYQDAISSYEKSLKIKPESGAVLVKLEKARKSQEELDKQ